MFVYDAWATVRISAMRITTGLAAVIVLALPGCSGAETAGDRAANEPSAATDGLAAASGPVQSVDRSALAASETDIVEGIAYHRLSFDKGSDSARVDGTITGDEVVDYLLKVHAGQTLNISLGTQHSATNFNLLEPGESAAAIFNGSQGENMYEGVAAKSGDYRIRVYMTRSAARRQEKANFVLEANAVG